MTIRKKNTSQNVIILMCWLVYSLSYLGRYSYNSNITLIIEDYGVTKAQAGLVATAFFFSYAIGQVFNGLLSQKYNKQWMFPIMLVLSSAINLAVFVGVPFFAIKYLWLINGFVQSCFWSGSISVISKTIDDRNMKKAMLMMSTTTCVGTIVTYAASSLFAAMDHYRLAFLFGAVVMTVLGIIWFIIYSPELEVYETETKSKNAENGTKSRANGIVALMIILGFFAVVDNVLKDGLTTWVPEILKDRYGIGDSLSILLTVVLPLLGVFGAVLSIRLNKYIESYVLLIAVLFGMGTVATGGITFFPGMSVIVAVICFGIVVCMMHGINNTVNTMAPLKLRDRIDSGKMAGIINGCAYAGSTISSYGLGRIADIGGWQTVLNLLFAISVFTVLVGVVYGMFEKKDNEKNSK